MGVLLRVFACSITFAFRVVPHFSKSLDEVSAPNKRSKSCRTYRGEASIGGLDDGERKGK